LVEIPAYLGTIPLVSYWGRRPTIVFTLLVTGVAYVAVPIVPSEKSALRITLAMIAKLFVCAGTAIFGLLAGELYPTENRSTGLSMASLVGRFGAITAPYLLKAKFGVGYEMVPVVVTGIVAMAAGLSALALPETKDVEMFENVAAIEASVVSRARRRSSVAAVGESHALSAPAPNGVHEDGKKREFKI
jgi:MFS family permease